ncbi:MAG: glutamate--tRNA ligase [Candidatus Omnitrophota bacterium]
MTTVRFAPSPTGYLHIGGSRTALFNWVFARHHKGKFILRIEDTDTLRSEKKYLDEILESLKWLGLDWDEIFFQSKRYDIYKKYAQQLLDGKKAYLEGTAIIFKVNPEIVKIDDAIHGEITFDTSTIKDQVLIKSDGTPTYNFACVIDDALMKMTHIIRGDDHISNTPKQIILYEALGFKSPIFAHLPLILAAGGGRMSKRKGATSIREYKELGYLPEAIVNYLLLLGWSPGENQELITLEEAAKKFTLEKANKTAATFDSEKLDWINNQYLKKADPQRLLDLLVPSLLEKKYINENFDRNYLISLVKLFQGRMNTLNDFVAWSDFFFLDDLNFEESALKILEAKNYSCEFSLLIEKMNILDNFDHASIEQAFRALVEGLKIKAKDLVHPVRAALTGKTIGPGLFETMSILGKDRIETRLKKFIGKEGA